MIYNGYNKRHTQNQINQMRQLVNDGYGIHYVARRFECCANSVFYHVYDLIPPKKISNKDQKRFLKNSNLTISKVKQIRKLNLERNVSASQLAKRFDISQTAALGIINGRTFRWVAGKTKKGEIVPVEYEYISKTDLKRGPKKGSTRRVKNGVLHKYAKKYGVKNCTICRWIKKGKLKLRENEYA